MIYILDNQRKYLPDKKKLQSGTDKAFKFPLFSIQENATWKAE